MSMKIMFNIENCNSVKDSQTIGGYILIQPTKRQSQYIGETYLLESNNYPQHRIGIRDDNTAGIILYGVEEFHIIEALNGQFDAVSLQSISDKNKYLRHQNFVLKLHPNDLSELFKNDASFKIRDDKYYPGYVSFESTNNPGYYLRHQDFIVKLHPEEPMVELYKRDASFKLVQLGFALNGRADCVSLQSMKDSNKYLRHQNFVLKFHPVNLMSELFKNDASFIMRDNNYYPGYVSFESTNYPGFFLRHQNFIVKLNKEEPFVELFTKDASFKLVEKVPKIGAIYSFESNNYPQHRIGVKDDNSAGIFLYGIEEFRIVKALIGKDDSVSLQSVKDSSKYLRHQFFILRLHTNDNTELFKYDASFIIRYDKYYPGYVSFESTNYPGYFLRHQDFIVKLHREEPLIELYRRDASFKCVQLGVAHIGKQYLIQSNNYPFYQIGVRDDGTAAILLNSIDLFLVVKALDGRADAVSFQSVKDKKKYLRHQNFILKLHSVDYSELFNNDASFIIRDNYYYPGFVSFESTNYPGFFLRHQDFTVKLNQEEPLFELYRKDASFKFL